MKQVWSILAFLVACCLLLTGCATTSEPTKTTIGTVATTPTTTTTTSITDVVDTTTVNVGTTTSTVRQTTATTTGTTAVVTTTATTTITSATTTTTAATTTTTSATTTTAAAATTTVATTTTTTITTTTTTPTVKPSSGEFRGAWVSYIELSDMFIKCGTPQQGKVAIDDLMDRLANAGMNAVFFHVRANSDAYYNSSIFKAAAVVEKLLDAGFDPLAYAVEAAHRRGLQLHAWLNPYRVGKDAAYIAKNTATFQDGNGRHYYIPTSAAAQRLILDGVRELLDTYAIDGIQYDDYFYPADLLGEETVYSFESADYAAYTAAGGSLSVGDWRRAGVDALIAGTHTLTKAKGKVFGVSPGHNAQRNHDSMFANTQKWLAQEGYVDYLCPQIYFGFQHSTASFDTVTDTWLGYERHPSVKLYVGLGIYKIGLKSDPHAGNGKTEWRDNSDILKRSVLYLRQAGIDGMGFYSSSFFDPAYAVGIFKTDHDLAVAENEINNLLSIL